MGSFAKFVSDRRNLLLRGHGGSIGSMNALDGGGREAGGPDDNNAAQGREKLFGFRSRPLG